MEHRAVPVVPSPVRYEALWRHVCCPSPPSEFALLRGSSRGAAMPAAHRVRCGTIWTPGRVCTRVCTCALRSDRTDNQTVGKINRGADQGKGKTGNFAQRWSARRCKCSSRCMLHGVPTRGIVALYIGRISRLDQLARVGGWPGNCAVRSPPSPSLRDASEPVACGEADCAGARRWPPTRCSRASCTRGSWWARSWGEASRW